MNGLSRFLRHFAALVCAIAVMGTTSCDKVKDLTSSAQSWLGDDDEKEEGGDQAADVISVDKTEGEKIINSESRLVMVEYYSDT